MQAFRVLTLVEVAGILELRATLGAHESNHPIMFDPQIQEDLFHDRAANFRNPHG